MLWNRLCQHCKKLHDICWVHIRARECTGAGGGRNCPVGLATMDEIKRSRYLVLQKAKHIANYHNELLYSVRSLLAVMGKSNTTELGVDDPISHK